MAVDGFVKSMLWFACLLGLIFGMVKPYPYRSIQGFIPMARFGEFGVFFSIYFGPNTWGLWMFTSSDSDSVSSDLVHQQHLGSWWFPSLTGWWFLSFFYFHPRKLGKIPILTHIFQRVETTNQLVLCTSLNTGRLIWIFFGTRRHETPWKQCKSLSQYSLLGVMAKFLSSNWLT